MTANRRREATAYSASAGAHSPLQENEDMKKIATLMLMVTLAGCTTMPSAKPGVTLQFRPGSQTPATGLTEMTVVGSDQKVYLSNEVVLSNADVKSARVVTGPSGPQIDIIFTQPGTERFTRATANNIMRPLGILVDGQLISAPIVREKITGGRAVMSGPFSEQEARRIAAGISAR
jgi:hypothetical protein